MRKKENIIWILFPIIWGFWLFFMQGHIGNLEGTNFFQCGSEYWKTFAGKPGGWTEYTGYFLLQFFQWSWLGALIQTLLLVVIFVASRGVIAKLGIKKSRLIVNTLPFLLVFALQLQNDHQMAISQLLRVALLYSFIWGYLHLTHPLTRYIITTLISPLVFLILGGAGTVAFYLSVALYEIWKCKGSTRIGVIVLWLVIVVAQPFIWREWVHTISMEDIYASVTEGSYLLCTIYGYFTILFILLWLVRNKQLNKDLFILESLFIGIIFVGSVYYLPNRINERFFRMEQAAIIGNWDDVIELAEEIEEPTREDMYLINLALASQGKLGDNMLDYSAEWGTGGLYLPREFDYKTSVLGGEFYYRLKIPNEAMHWTFQGSVASPQGMDFRVLRRLIEINVLKRDTIIADKYLSILENTNAYAAWCRERRDELSDPSSEQVLPTTKNDFFIGSRPFVSDMARVMDAGRSSDMTLNYILCYLLMNKDLPKFCQLLDILYEPIEGEMPKAYQEAVLMALSSKITLNKSYHIDAEINKRFVEYNASSSFTSKNKKQAKQLMSSFKDTWWYYLNFTETKKINPRGQVYSH